MLGTRLEGEEQIGVHHIEAIYFSVTFGCLWHNITGATTADFHIRRTAVPDDDLAFALVQEKKRRFENIAVLANQAQASRLLRRMKWPLHF